MKKYIFILFCFHLTCLGQNFVPNPSFETYSSCPVGAGQVYLAVPWADPTNSSSDLFNACASFSSGVAVPENMMGIGGWQYPRSGNGYAGLLAYVPFDGREYVQVALLDSLTSGILYRVEFYVNLSNIEKYAIDEIGAYFSPTAITGPISSVLSYTPQVSSPPGIYLSDTLNWMQIVGTFTAVGGEKYLTIGNFKTNALTDKIIVNPTGYDSCCTYYHVDDVQVYPDSVTSAMQLQKDNSISVYPNPAKGELFISVNDKNIKSVFVEVTDMTGKLVYSSEITINEMVGKLNLNIHNGIYLIKITESNSRKQTVRKVVINK